MAVNFLDSLDIDGNLTLTPASGAVTSLLKLGAVGGAVGFVALKAPDALSTVQTTYVLPGAYPTTGQVLSCTNLGVMSWLSAGTNTNIATTDLTVSGARTLDLSGNTLEFYSGSENLLLLVPTLNELQTTADVILEASGSSGVTSLLTFGVVTGNTGSVSLRAPSSVTSGGGDVYILPAALPSVAGDVLSSTTTGTMSWATAGGTDTNIANTDLTLDADRRTDLDGYDLVFDSGATDIMTLNGGDDNVTIHGELDVNGRLQPGYLKVKNPSPFSTAGAYASAAEVLFAGAIPGALANGSCIAVGSSGWAASSGATEVSAAIGLLGIKSTLSGGAITRGTVYLATDPGGNLGDVVYLSATTAGELTTTAPTGTAGFVVRVVGYKLATNIIFFNPSKDWIVI